MRELPRLPDDVISATLARHYGMPGARLTFLPIGNDPDSYAYRVDGEDGVARFLKLRSAPAFRVASLVVPRWLEDRGVPHVVAPLRTRSGDLWVRLEDYALSLQPYTPARCAADTGLTRVQWRELGATLRRIHDEPLVSFPGVLPRETWVPSRRELMSTLEAAHSEVWRAHTDRIREVTELSDGLAQRMSARAAPHVLCHADFHTWNILRDEEERVWVVDWDEAVLAPRERDLMFVVGGIGAGLVSASETECFLDGYGKCAIDALSLAYYRAAWAVQDIASFAERLLLTPELTAESRREALQGFEGLFAPGNIVDIALTTEIPE